ncbi:hypothetical protein [Metallibacterium sp.]
MGEPLDTLMELDGIFSGTQALLEDPAKPANAKDLEGLRKHITKLTAIAEQEIHAVVLGAHVLREQACAGGERGIGRALTGCRSHSTGIKAPRMAQCDPKETVEIGRHQIKI